MVHKTQNRTPYENQSVTLRHVRRGLETPDFLEPKNAKIRNTGALKLGRLYLVTPIQGLSDTCIQGRVYTDTTGTPTQGHLYCPALRQVPILLLLHSDHSSSGHSRVDIRRTFSPFGFALFQGCFFSEDLVFYRCMVRKTRRWANHCVFLPQKGSRVSALPNDNPEYRNGTALFLVPQKSCLRCSAMSVHAFS